MRFIVPILFVLIISCSGNKQKHPSDQETRDSIAKAYGKYCDSVYQVKLEKSQKLRTLIPFSKDYYAWCEITFTDNIRDKSQEYGCIIIGETMEPEISLSSDCYGISGSYNITNIINEKKDVLFETVSQIEKDTVLWKLKFLTKDSATAEWSYKKVTDTGFISRGSFMLKKYLDQSPH